MQVNRSSASGLRSTSIRMDAANTGVAPATVGGIAPAAASDDSLSDGTPRPPLVPYALEDELGPDRMLDAIDPDLAYRAAISVLRREGMIGLLLNRNA
jgi:hypothetical protein